jgi:hypothetical protein
MPLLLAFLYKNDVFKKKVAFFAFSYHFYPKKFCGAKTKLWSEAEHLIGGKKKSEIKRAPRCEVPFGCRGAT